MEGCAGVNLHTVMAVNVHVYLDAGGSAPLDLFCDHGCGGGLPLNGG